MFLDSKKTATKTAACLTVALLAVAIVPARAQENAEADTNAKLLACGSITDQAARMDCFDAVVESLAENSAAADAPAPAPMPEPRPEPRPAAVAEAPGRTTPAVATGAATTTVTTAPAAQRPVTVVPGRADSPAVAAGSRAPSVSPVAPEPAAAKAAPSGSSAAAEAVDADAQDDPIASFGLGDMEARAAAEQRKKKPEIDTLRATIVEAWETIDGRFEVRLDNGQVWRETERTRTTRFPKAGTPVRITTGSLGSYNMKFGGDNRLAGVRRTE